jgi:hypothetical protein
VDVALADAAGDDLRVLGAEVENCDDSHVEGKLKMTAGRKRRRTER